jgi:hypothetical protein
LKILDVNYLLLGQILGVDIFKPDRRRCWGVFFFFPFLLGNYKCELMARRSLQEASVLDPAIIDAYSI